MRFWMRNIVTLTAIAASLVLISVAFVSSVAGEATSGEATASADSTTGGGATASADSTTGGGATEPADSTTGSEATESADSTTSGGAIEPADSVMTDRSAVTADSSRTTDSTRVAVPTEADSQIPMPRMTTRAPYNPAFPADTLDSDTFHARHAYSLDHFFEGWPFYFLGRSGPIGAATRYSRFGMGGGRCVVYLGSVSFNDPQDNTAQFAVVPTTPIGDLVLGGGDSDVFLPDRSNVEGAIQIAREIPPTERPRTFIEISKGDHELGQRRVKFSSVAGRVGIDFGYDEARTDGYSFDARGLVDGAYYGRTRTRIQSANVRGQLPSGGDYLFSFRRYSSNVDGDLIAPDRTHRRDGHIGLIETWFGRFQLSLFERTHKVNTPDSLTANLTTGAYLTIPVSLRPRKAFSLGVGYERIFSRQEMRYNQSTPRLQRAFAGANGRVGIGAGFSGRFELNLTHYVDMSTGWGGRIVVGRQLGANNEAIVQVRRGFRMPSLGELYLPIHTTISGGAVIEGNRYVKNESSLDASAGFVTRFSGFKNEIRATATRMRDPILFSETSSSSVLRPMNGAEEDLFIVEDRLGLRGTVLSIGFRFDGAVAYTPSERGRFFSPVPRWRTNARLGFGRAFFKNTSELWITGEYEYTGDRSSGSVLHVPTYSVYNIKLDFRLLSAHMYLQWLNVSDEKYVTVWPYLMTPRTFVYGIEWTLWE